MIETLVNTSSSPKNSPHCLRIFRILNLSRRRKRSHTAFHIDTFSPCVRRSNLIQRISNRNLHLRILSLAFQCLYSRLLITLIKPLSYESV
jgi:hypothetical protein